MVWLALGSEGRREQTVHTDQDNALLFDAPDAAAMRAQLLPFATEVNRILDGLDHSVILSLPGLESNLDLAICASP
mgnify:CR=1 FL=1